jgi:hypothetical protein
MKAFFIDPLKSEIRVIDLTNGDEEIKQLLGAKALEFDEIAAGGDRLCFDEDCFITQKPGRFQLDTLAPVAGSALLLGAAAADGAPTDVLIDQEALRARIKFLS